MVGDGKPVEGERGSGWVCVICGSAAQLYSMSVTQCKASVILGHDFRVLFSRFADYVVSG